MKDEITIVTAYFDINRGTMSGFNRGNSVYLSYFEFWARIKNKIVVFSDSKTIEEVKKIREKYGLLDKTEVVIIDNYLDIDKELYFSIKSAMDNSFLLDFHLQRNIPEAISAKYNYIMALKSWCCNEAVDRGLASGMIAWLDFGFNYGGRFYKKTEDFDFLWKYKFDDKINLLQVNDFDNCPPFEIIRRNNSYIQGGEIVAPDYLWRELWKLVRENMFYLNRCGLADDDQLLYLMAYYEKPDIFKLHKCEWLGLFKHFSNHHFEFEPPKPRKIYNFLYKCKHLTEFLIIRRLVYCIRTFVNLQKSGFKK